MIPEFKNGNYDVGMLAGVERIVSTVKDEPFETKPEAPFAWNEVLPLAAGFYLILIIVSLVWVSNIVKKVRKDSRYPNNIARYKVIKSNKTSVLMLIAVLVPIIGFVAIILLKLAFELIVLLLVVPFTTIPANLYAKVMMRKIRREPILCNECDGKMHILSEKQEDAHLKLAQQFEEQLHAVDYDVFVCDSCKNEAIFTLDKPSAYSNCPKCNRRTLCTIKIYTPWPPPSKRMWRSSRPPAVALASTCNPSWPCAPVSTTSTTGSCQAPSGCVT
jgi:uncharacterized protein